VTASVGFPRALEVSHCLYLPIISIQSHDIMFPCHLYFYLAYLQEDTITKCFHRGKHATFNRLRPSAFTGNELQVGLIRE